MQPHNNFAYIQQPKTVQILNEIWLRIESITLRICQFFVLDILSTQCHRRISVSRKTASFDPPPRCSVSYDASAWHAVCSAAAGERWRQQTMGRRDDWSHRGRGREGISRIKAIIEQMGLVRPPSLMVWTACCVRCSSYPALKRSHPLSPASLTCCVSLSLHNALRHLPLRSPPPLLTEEACVYCIRLCCMCVCVCE